MLAYGGLGRSGVGEFVFGLALAIFVVESFFEAKKQVFFSYLSR